MQQQQQSSGAINGAKEAIRSAFKGGGDAWERFDRRYDVTNVAKQGKEQAKKHPALALFFGSTVLLCSVPVIVFVVFAVTSLAFSVVGFVFVEGTLLTLGLCLLSGVLLVVGLFAITFGGFLAVSYIFVANTYQLANSLWAKQQQQTVKAPSAAGSRAYLTSPQYETE